MQEANLKIVFEGSAVEDGTMDVNYLAPALLSFCNLIQEINTATNGDRAKVSARVKATARGSFEVDLSFWQSLVESAKALFDYGGEISTVTNLTILTGGVFKLILFLKGKKPDKIEHKDDDVEIVLNGETFVTSEKVLRLCENLQVRESAKKSVEVLQKQGMSSLRIKSDAQQPVEITKNDVDYFNIPSHESEIENLVRKMTLQIISLSFKEDNKWRVTDGEQFNVTIKDIDFLHRISNDEISFSKGDYLICEVEEIQFKTTSGLRKERTILKVLEHQKAPKQLMLV